jgi:thiol:disulfide interchange protein
MPAAARRSMVGLTLLLALAAGFWSSLPAQDDGGGLNLNGDLLKNGLGVPRTGPAADVDEVSQVSFSAEYRLKRDSHEGVLTVAAELVDGWHVYSTKQQKPPIKTQIKIADENLAAPLDANAITADRAPKIHFDDVFPGVPLEEHEERVTWSIPLELKEGVEQKPKELPLVISGQVCKEACIRFKKEVTAKFAGYTDEVKSLQSPGIAETLRSAESSSAGPVKIVGDARLPFWQAALFGVLGGLILNVMPCVLPVIGLKIIAFAEQAGHSRSRVLALNLWYCAGLLSVFLVLATLAAFLNIGWSDQFKSPTFRYVMLGGVFVMGLSFLGVWEIPIPGFASTAHTEKLQQQEGAAGAFSKGMFTTILATPCSGPFLGGVFFYALAAPWYEIYAIFTCIGLGMALPYLIVGLEPSLVKWLPKPGAWMDTFKQLMGFVMLGTGIYLFQTVQTPGNTLAVLTMLLGLAIGCWWIGQVPNYAESSDKLRAWAVGGTLAALIGFGGFHYLAAETPPDVVNAKSPESLGQLYTWTPYTPDALRAAQAEGKTVMIDFTAKWCPNCHFNWRTAINTQGVKEVVDRNGVAALLADWTDDDAAITQKLRELGSGSIPFLAIYPAGKPNEVIVLRDVITQSQLLDALKTAGPSQSATAGKQESRVPSEQLSSMP